MQILPNRVLLLFILKCVMALSDNITEGFVRVTEYCPESSSAFGEILILSDQVEAFPYALCRGQEHTFIKICTGVYRLRFRHSGDPTKDCLSTLLNEDHYAVQVNLPVNEGLVTLHTETQIVRCPKKLHRPPPKMNLSNSEDLIFQSNQSALAQNHTKLQLLADAMEKPEPILVRIQVKELDDSPSNATFQIYSLVNKPRIKGNGVSPIKCKLYYNSGVKVIIDNGCSNGSVLPINTGFKVQGIVSWSPVFSFPIPIDCYVSVDCSFGICKDRCDGSSCRSHDVEIIDVYNAHTEVFLSPCVDDRHSPSNLEDVKMQVIPGSLPSLEDNPMTEDNTTAHNVESNTAPLNVPLIIALSVLVPIACILLFSTCWYRSKVNFGAYRVRNRGNP